MYETSSFFIWDIIGEKNYLATDLHSPDKRRRGQGLSLMLKTKKKTLTAKAQRTQRKT
jgi:hypothetical protein